MLLLLSGGGGGGGGGGVFNMLKFRCLYIPMSVTVNGRCQTVLRICGQAKDFTGLWVRELFVENRIAS